MSKIDENWIQNQAKKLHHELFGEQDEEDYVHGAAFYDIQDFIRTIVEDCKPKVNQVFMEKWNKIFDGGHGYPTKWEALEAMLKEAGVEVEDA